MKSIQKKRDPIKGLILERQREERISSLDLAKKMHISVRTLSRMMNERHTDEWQLKYVRLALWALNVTQEQFAASLTAGRR